MSLLVPETWDTDATPLGSLLHAAKTPVPLELVCDTLAWPLDRAHAAAELLDDRLRPAGMRLHHNRGCLALVAVHESANVEQIQQMFRRHRARKLLMRADAQVLLNLLTARSRCLTTPTALEHDCAARG